jgi:membrane protein implicated in regulation of membrane protease activity
MGSSLWLLGGIGFLVLELFVPVGFYFFLLGCSAMLVGGVVAIGFLPTLNLQLGAFVVMAIAFPFIFAAKLKELFPRKIDGSGSDMIGQIVTVQDLILPGAIGVGQLWGSPWRIKNTDSTSIDKGDEVVVVSAEGVTLSVKRRDA